MNLKYKILPFTLFTFLLVLSACGGRNQQNENADKNLSMESDSRAIQNSKDSAANMHNQHKNLADSFAHKDIVILDNPYQIIETTKTELENLIDAYMQIKEALFNEDEKATDKAIVLMLAKVNNVVPTTLSGEGLDAWQNHQKLYLVKLKEMKHISGLNNKRSYFSHLSEIMYCTIKSFGLKQGHLFAIFCPMAFDGKGAYWISDSKVVQNPYLGSRMPTCGEVKEEL